MQSAKKKSFLEFALIFLVIYLLTNIGMQYFFPQEEDPAAGPSAGSVTLRAMDPTVKGGHHPILLLKNNTQEDFIVPNNCPMPPVDVFFVQGVPGNETLKPLSTEVTAIPCEAFGTVDPGKEVQIDLAPWKTSLFSAYGTYEVRLLTEAIEATEETEEAEGMVVRFSLYEPGWITQVFRTFISKPLLNFLVLIASLLPGYNLGMAIILLTFFVKVVLFFPTQHALEGQKKLQKVQPKLDEIKRKHKANPKKMQEETMKIWKEFGINPMQSCLPILIQFPVLIGLFFVIRDGSILALSQHLLYAPYQDLSWVWGTSFLGLDLMEPSIYVMPPLLVVMQFVQMKLSFSIAAKKKGELKDGKKKDKKEAQSAQQMQQNIMLYGLPLMIGFFAVKFPAAVSLYWAVSTVFAIGQQVFVNRRTL